MIRRDGMNLDQSGHTLRGVARDYRIKEGVRKKQKFDASVDLGQELFGERSCRFAEEHSAQSLAAADRFFDELHAFNGAFAFGREFAAAEGLAQFLEARIVATGDAVQSGAVSDVPGGFRVLLHGLVPRSG